MERRRENERMVSGSRALSIGSLGHSYASAAGTITRKSHLLHKMRRVPLESLMKSLLSAPCKSIAIVRAWAAAFPYKSPC